MRNSFLILFLIIAPYCLKAQGIMPDSLLKKRALYNAQAISPQVKLKSSRGSIHPGSIEVDRNEIYASYTPQQLVENLFVKSGACAKVENVIYRGAGWNGTKWDDFGNKTLGYFNRGSSNFPLKEGLIMSVADVWTIEGPNNNKVSPIIDPAVGDDDLESLTGGVTDVAVLEFDFVPVNDKIEFRYIFASEEYPFYVNSQFNDVFGFFVNEIGNANKENIAVLPTTHTSTYIVSINNVNNGYKPDNLDTSSGFNPSNSQYFITNIDDSPTTEFNGYTVLLTAAYNVTPCKKYHLKIAVGNVMDNGLPSGVFLEAYSFNTGSKVEHYVENFGETDKIFEGCESNVLRVLRIGGNMAMTETVELSYSGTAINGVDYMSNGAALPAIVTIPPGADHVDIVYSAIDNGISDNGKYFTISSSCPCSSETNTMRVYIYEPAELSVVAACSGISANGTGGTGNYEYSIDNINWQTSNHFIGLPLGEYTVYMRDIGSCINPKMQKAIIGTLDISAGEDQIQCGNDLFVLSGTIPGSTQSGTWSVVGNNPGVTIGNPSHYNTNVIVPIGTQVTLKWTVIEGICIGSDEITLTNVVNLQYSLSKEDNTCKANITINNITGGYEHDYQYSINNGTDWQSTGKFTDLSGDKYTVMIKDQGEYCQTDTIIYLSQDYLTIKPDTLPLYQINKPYNVTFESSAKPPLLYTTVDKLPDGLYLSPDGYIYGTPLLQGSRMYEITIKLTDADGCEAFKTYQLEGKIVIPQIITPDGDGKNDHFMQGFHVVIFDRMGIKLFEGNDGWDGTYNGKVVAPDTYFYIVYDKEEKKSGHITVLK